MTYYDVVADSIFNRLTWLVFTLTFLLLVFGWIETVHIKYPAPVDKFVPVVKWVFIILSIAIGLMMIITTIIWLVGRVGHQQMPASFYPAYNSNIYIFALVQLIVSALFLVYGLILVFRLRSGLSNRHSLVVVDSRHLARQRATFMKIILVMSIMTLCFALRATFMLLRVTSGICVPDAVFYVFAYIIPEIVPPIVEMFVIISTSEAKKRMSTASTSSTSGLGAGMSSSRGSSNLTSSMASATDEPLLKEDYLGDATVDDGTGADVNYDHIEEDDDNELRSSIEEH